LILLFLTVDISIFRSISKRLFTSLVFCCGIALLNGQSPTLQGSIWTGKIIKHNTDIVFDTDSPTYAAELGVVWQTRGQKDWHELQDFPKFFLGIHYHDLGKDELVGEAIGLNLGMEVNLFRKSDAALLFGFGSGIAYLTRPYDRISNPENIAIGGHWNNTVSLKLDYEHIFLRSSLLHIGLGLAHYSNGARKLPNLGLNIPYLYIGISPYRGTYEKDYFQRKSLSKVADKKWGFGLHTQYTRVEIRVPGGPDYPTTVAGIDGHFHPSANNRLSLGYQYEYNASIAAFGLHTGDFADDAAARVGATRHSVTIGNEFLFGHWAVQLKVGAYFLHHNSFLLPLPFYFQLSPRYYFNYRENQPARFFTGIHLKSHLFVAEYISWGVGVVF